MKLLNVDQNAKTVKGQKRGYLTGILYLAPARISGYEVCPGRSRGCTADCLNTAGRGAFSAVQAARIRKTKWYFIHREAFLDALVKDISALEARAASSNLTPVIRLNGTSDIAWERVGKEDAPNVMALFPKIQFYDYTKVVKRAVQAAQDPEWPKNYHMTFSRSEDNEEACQMALCRGANVAVVFRKELPKQLWGWPVFDGDQNDLRFLDPSPVIVGLKAKGRARKDTTGFVVDAV